jgi:hypothetical protein
MDSIAFVVYTISRNSGGLVKERDELVPRPTPHVDRARVLFTEVGLETSEGNFGGLQAGRGVNRSHASCDLFAISVRHEFHSIANTAHLMPMPA